MGRVLLKIGRLKLDGTHLINVISRPSFSPRSTGERSPGFTTSPHISVPETNHQLPSPTLLSPGSSHSSLPAHQEPKVTVINQPVSPKPYTELQSTVTKATVDQKEPSSISIGAKPTNGVAPAKMVPTTGDKVSLHSNNSSLRREQ